MNSVSFDVSKNRKMTVNFELLKVSKIKIYIMKKQNLETSNLDSR